MQKLILFAKPVGNRAAEIISEDINKSIREELLFKTVACKKTGKTYEINGKFVNSDIEVEIKRRQIRKKHQNYILGGTVDVKDTIEG